MIKPDFDFCVLIPCFNNTAGLITSIQSIQYNKGSFFILIIDDGSKQKIKVGDLPAQFSNNTIQILRLDTNEGISIALNHGLSWIKQSLKINYIARLDCGDICSPFRFDKQVEFLNHHSSIALLGTWCIFKNYQTGEVYNYTTSTKHNDIQREMHFKNVFIHPTVMFRYEVLEENIFYPTKYKYAEDYAYFWIILKRFDVAVIDECLVTCELNLNSISAINRKNQLKERKLILHEFATRKWLKIAGLLRLSLLLVIPDSILLKLKKLV